MSSAASHVDEEALELFCLGRATSRELAPIERHLLDCPACLIRAHAALEYVDSLRAALQRLEVAQSPIEDGAGAQ